MIFLFSQVYFDKMCVDDEESWSYMNSGIEYYEGMCTTIK